MSPEQEKLAIQIPVLPLFPLIFISSKGLPIASVDSDYGQYVLNVLNLPSHLFGFTRMIFVIPTTAGGHEFRF